MTTYFSFRNTLRTYGLGLIQPTPNDRFVFNCSRERVFSSSSLIPGSVSFLNDKQDHFPNNHLISSDQLHPDTFELWRKLRVVLEEADQRGNIQYRDPADFNEVVVEYFNTPDSYWFNCPIVPPKTSSQSLSQLQELASQIEQWTDPEV